MSDYRRLWRPGGCYFFTVNLARPGEDLLVRHVDLFRACYARCLADAPFRTDAIVVQPDHLHAIWTLPRGDADFATRWRRIKAGFSRGLGQTRGRSESKRRKGERGIWQRRYWVHCIRDADDMGAHLSHVLCNPVTHGYVSCATDWPYSSIHRDIAAGRVAREGIL